MCMPSQGGSFRPLTGILFFNSTDYFKGTGSKWEGFRPLTGILFFNSIHMD